MRSHSTVPCRYSTGAGVCSNSWRETLLSKVENKCTNKVVNSVSAEAGAVSNVPRRGHSAHKTVLEAETAAL